MTVRYENGKPIEIEKVLISTQHKPGVDAETLIKPDLWEHVRAPGPAGASSTTRRSCATSLLVNPTGKFEIGGPMGDAGLTGRKIIVDTYGGAARHGGGAFSGKDPSKVDRSAAYAARYVAKNVVAAGLADRCEVQVAYAIGVAHPVSVMVETYGTEQVPRSTIAELVDEHFDLRPGAFRQYLDLHRPIYRRPRPTATSAARTTTSRGRRRTRRRRCARPLGSRRARRRRRSCGRAAGGACAPVVPSRPRSTLGREVTTVAAHARGADLCIGRMPAASPQPFLLLGWNSRPPRA